MGIYKYITNRTVANKAGKEAGRIKACVKSDSDTAEIDYICAECGKSEHTSQPFRRPFSVKCRECGYLMRVSKIKDEIKREKKKKA